MSEHEGLAARAVYDHEVDEPHLAGRRRAVADWGVGEEIFDHLPRRRFRGSEGQRREHRPRERRGGRFEPAGDERRAARTEPAADERFEPVIEDPRQERFEPTGGQRVEPAAAESPFQSWDDEPHRGGAAPAAEARLGPTSPISPLEPAPEPAADFAEPPPEGRRTVVIRGRGAEPHWTPRVRPPRTVGERIGPRPDRLAAWAVALGMLLILIAILTAHG
jgi:hypothetical protein